MNLTEKIINNLAEHRIGLEEYFFLWCLVNGNNWYLKLGISSDAMVRKLIRRKYILKDNLELTHSAKLLLEGNLEYKPSKIAEQLKAEKKEKSDLRDSLKDKFLEFWNTYPTTDKWGTWPKTRVLRADKARAMRYYVGIVYKDKKATPDQLLGALKKDIEMKRKASTMENKLKYMPAITSWLNKSYYEGFLEDEQNLNANGTPTKRYGEDVE